MRKVLVLPLLALAVVLPAALATAADDVDGPACANITDPDFFYAPGEETVNVNLHIDAASSCPFIRYTLFAQDETGVSTIVAEASVQGDGEPLFGSPTDVVSVEATTTEQDGTVCVYATTSVGPHVFDRAPDADGVSTPPDADCVELRPGDSGGGVGFG